MFAGPARFLRRALTPLVLTALLAPAASAALDSPPTATVYVHGFELTGAERHGVFGDEVHEAVAESVAALAGLPTAQTPSGPLPSRVVAGTTYYGDQAPSYYRDADRAELDRITAEWGGGVPRYAFIVARHARHVLERSGARQVNFVSASFGSLIVRWLIEKNVDGLAGEGRIARWLTIEGVVAGNWAASHEQLVDLLSVVAPEPVDLRHMDYRWVETHLHTPRTEADSRYYAGLLIGQVASTDDGGAGAPLRDAMLLSGEYQPNDGVQGLDDAWFQNVTAASRFAGMPPTRALFHTDHLGIKNERGAWAEAATFLTATRRVTVTMTSARVSNLHEVQLPFWDWTPAEVLFESRVFSPAAADRWAIAGPLCAHVKEGAAAPLERYGSRGEARSFQHVLFDDLVLPEETRLRLDLRATEVDYDPRYGVFETVQGPFTDDIGGGTLWVSTLTPGSYTFTTADWSCAITVGVFDYPAPPPVDVPAAPQAPPENASLVVVPNPSPAGVRIIAPAPGAAASAENATLEIMDVSGRIVRRISGRLSAGYEWNGRDADGRAVESGVYFYRLAAPGRTWLGRSTRLR
jgi:hypothetical protein